MFLPGFITQALLTAGSMSFDLTSGVVDALLFRPVTPGTNAAIEGDTYAEAWLATTTLKVIYTDERGRSKVIIDDTSLRYYGDEQERRGGFFDPGMGIVVPVGRRNLTGGARLTCRLTYGDINAGSDASGGSVQVHRLNRDLDDADAVLPIVRSVAVGVGASRIESMVPNLTAAYINGTFTSVTIETEGGSIEIDREMAIALMHYEHLSNGENDTVQVYDAGLLESISRQGVQFVVEGGGGNGRLTFVGFEPSPDTFQTTKQQAERAAATKLAQAAIVNAEAAAGAIIRGEISPAVIAQSGAIATLQTSRTATIKR